ncbi:MAG: DoxX family protein [Pirellulales bacterium]
MIVDRRRILGTFAIMALVLLRLVVGWHFFREGSQKVEYDRRDGQFSLAFSSADFLTQAKGPLAKWYHAQAPDDHGWRELLAEPRRNVPPTAEEDDERSKWRADYERRRADATKKVEAAPVEFPPSAPYREWAEQIAADWRDVLADVKSVSGLDDDQKQRADAALNARLQQLADYLASETDAITEYRHELWRLENWRNAPESGDVPFHQQRIATKTAETNGQPNAWLNQVRAFEIDYHNDLRGVLTSEQRADAATDVAFDAALTDNRQEGLRRVDLAVASLTIGVGVCLLLGLFTRLASIAGALFLLAVIASQPPWLPSAELTMPHVIEFAALLVLAGTGAGRWAGLDYIGYALTNRFRRHEMEA